MTKYINLLEENQLFQGLSSAEILQIIDTEACMVKQYKKGNSIYNFYQEMTLPGIILEGSADILQPSIHGHEVIVNRLSKGDRFGFSYACAKQENRINDIRCVGDAQILFMDIMYLLKGNFLCAKLRESLLRNLIVVLALGGIELNVRVQILGQRSLKEKLMTYFNHLGKKRNSSVIELVFNREELAAYLCSERSSISRELGKLSEERKIHICGNRIKILEEW